MSTTHAIALSGFFVCMACMSENILCACTVNLLLSPWRPLVFNRMHMHLVNPLSSCFPALSDILNNYTITQLFSILKTASCCTQRMNGGCVSHYKAKYSGGQRENKRLQRYKKTKKESARKMHCKCSDLLPMISSLLGHLPVLRCHQQWGMSVL